MNATKPEPPDALTMLVGLPVVIVLGTASVIAGVAFLTWCVVKAYHLFVGVLG